MRYAFKCAVKTCQKDGNRGFFRFPKPQRRLRRWLENLDMDAVPFPSARVCFKHFSYPGDISINKSTNKPKLSQGKLHTIFIYYKKLFMSHCQVYQLSARGLVYRLSFDKLKLTRLEPIWLNLNHFLICVQCIQVVSIVSSKVLHSLSNPDPDCVEPTT